MYTLSPPLRQALTSSLVSNPTRITDFQIAAEIKRGGIFINKSHPKRVSKAILTYPVKEKTGQATMNGLESDEKFRIAIKSSVRACVPRRYNVSTF